MSAPRDSGLNAQALRLTRYLRLASGVSAWALAFPLYGLRAAPGSIRGPIHPRPLLTTENLELTLTPP